MASYSAVMPGICVEDRLASLTDHCGKVKSWKAETSTRLFTNITILPSSKLRRVVLLHSSSDLAPLARTAASTRPLPTALSARAAARGLCSAFCFASLLAHFWVCGANLKRIVRILRKNTLVFESMPSMRKSQVLLKSLKTITSYLWTGFAHCALSCTLTSLVLLFLRVCNIWVKSRFPLPCTLIIRCALTILRRLCVYTVLVLGIFPR